MGNQSSIGAEQSAVIHIDPDAIGDCLPNLDCFTSPETLLGIEQEAKELSVHFRTFASYCEGKRHAMQCRLAGKIELALKFEAACDVVYKRLPTSFKW